MRKWRKNRLHLGKEQKHMLNNNFYFDLVIIFSTLLSLQGILSLYQLLYGLLHPENMQKNTIATLQVVAKTTFSIIIPCRHEEKVIGDTLKIFCPWIIQSGLSKFLSQLALTI